MTALTASSPVQSSGHAAGSPISDPYGRFAAAYAAGNERRFSEAMANFALQRAEQGKRHCHSVLDLACGIGAACEYYAARGLRTFGVDASPEMLRRAQESARAAGLPIDYSQQDMRTFTTAEPVDLVTCMYDSLNNLLTLADLQATFERVRAATVAGGTFIFDMYTVHGLGVRWGDNDEIHTVHDDHFVATRTTWNPDSATSTKTLWGFDRTGETAGDATWHRWQERHTVRAYPICEIERALAANRFEVADALSWQDGAPHSLSSNTERVLLIAAATT